MAKAYRPEALETQSKYKLGHGKDGNYLVLNLSKGVTNLWSKKIVASEGPVTLYKTS